MFGSIYYVHVLEFKRDKLNHRANVGYNSNTKGYRVYNLDTNKLIINRNVMFMKLLNGITMRRKFKPWKNRLPKNKIKFKRINFHMMRNAIGINGIRPLADKRCIICNVFSIFGEKLKLLLKASKTGTKTPKNKATLQKPRQQK